MGWFWGSSDSNNNKTTSTRSDVVDNLDPNLREFLKKEAPRAPPPAPPLSSNPAGPQPTESLRKSASQTSATQPEPSKPIVPPESLFQDGRYAHIWKTYRPYTEIEAVGKSEQEKLTDIVEAFNDRKAAIGRAALENCAEENWEMNECFRIGGWGQRINLCKTENRRFNRCYEMQSRFMKALGYLSLEQRTPEEEERIQMHADKLYHRMLAQEKAIEEAKKEGRPIPEFKPVMSKENFDAVLKESGIRPAYAPQTTTPTSSVALNSNLPTPSMPGRGEEWGYEQIPENIRAEMEKRLARKSAEEKALEERALEAELTITSVVGKEVSEILAAEERARAERKAQGRPTLGDRVKDFWGR